MTMITKNPHSAYAMNEAGPVLPITTPEPTNRPAPITPPMAIILNWRSLSAFFRVGAAPMVGLRYCELSMNWSDGPPLQCDGAARRTPMDFVERVMLLRALERGGSKGGWSPCPGRRIEGVGLVGPTSTAPSEIVAGLWI